MKKQRSNRAKPERQRRLRQPALAPILLGTRDAAAYLGMCERKLWELTDRGILKAQPLDPTTKHCRKKLYHRDVLDAFAERFKEASDEATKANAAATATR